MELKQVYFYPNSLLASCASTNPKPKSPLEEIAFPSEHSEHAVNTLLAQYPYPADSLKLCTSELSAITNTVESENHLLDAKKELAPQIIADRPNYHWCFFNLASKLDYQMRNRELSLRERGRFS